LPCQEKYCILLLDLIPIISSAKPSWSLCSEDFTEGFFIDIGQVLYYNECV